LISWQLLISHGENRPEPLSLHRFFDLKAARRNHYLRVLPLTQAWDRSIAQSPNCPIA
jgi:hypothetical protein